VLKIAAIDATIVNCVFIVVTVLRIDRIAKAGRSSCGCGCLDMVETG
jgi:hypothetical protein